MTLLTAICTENWVALAADRRITATQQGTTTWQADADTKIAAVDGEYLVAYTGHVPTSDGVRGFEPWLHQNLLEFKKGNLHDHLVDRLSSDVHLRERRFMLVTVGFTSNSFHLPEHADLTVISNSMTDSGDFSAFSKVHPFRAMHNAKPRGREISALTEGEDVAEQEVDLHLEEPVKMCHVLNDATLPLLYAAIGSFYAAISEQSGGTVGADVLIVVLPRVGFGRQGVTGRSMGLGELDAPTLAVFRRSDGRLTDDYMPALLSSSRPGRSGLSIMQGRMEQNACGPIGPVVPMTDESPGKY